MYVVSWGEGRKAKGEGEKNERRMGSSSRMGFRKASSERKGEERSRRVRDLGSGFCGEGERKFDQISFKMESGSWFLCPISPHATNQSHRLNTFGMSNSLMLGRAEVSIYYSPAPDKTPPFRLRSSASTATSTAPRSSLSPNQPSCAHDTIATHPKK